jgi:hypothetical protein
VEIGLDEDAAVGDISFSQTSKGMSKYALFTPFVSYHSRHSFNCVLNNVPSGMFGIQLEDIFISDEKYS